MDHSLYSSAKRRVLEQEEPGDFEREKTETDCQIEYKGLDGDALGILACTSACVDDTDEATLGRVGRILGHSVCLSKSEDQTVQKVISEMYV